MHLWEINLHCFCTFCTICPVFGFLQRAQDMLWRFLAGNGAWYIINRDSVRAGASTRLGRFYPFN